MKGIDISNHNGNIDFNKVKNEEVEVVYIKATEGTTYKDDYLDKHYKGAKEVGLKTGFYHFLVGSSDPESQAENFYNNIKDKQNDLKPCLDVEVNNFDVMDYALRFIKKFESLSNLPICIYTSPYFANDNLNDSLDKYSCWIAHYGVETPMKTNIWGNSYAGHQYSETGKVNGINTNVDVNNFTNDILVDINKKYYVVTNYIRPGYRESGDVDCGIDIEYVQAYFPGIRIYAKHNEKGIWFVTQYLSREKCEELKKSLGCWFYEIKEE